VLNCVAVLRWSGSTNRRRPGGGIKAKVHGAVRKRRSLLAQEAVVAQVAISRIIIANDNTTRSSSSASGRSTTRAGSPLTGRNMSSAGGKLTGRNTARSMIGDRMGISAGCGDAGHTETNDVGLGGSSGNLTVVDITISDFHKFIFILVQNRNYVARQHVHTTVYPQLQG
jgi:hypothetical protein